MRRNMNWLRGLGRVGRGWALKVNEVTLAKTQMMMTWAHAATAMAQQPVAEARKDDEDFKDILMTSSGLCSHRLRHIAGIGPLSVRGVVEAMRRSIWRTGHRRGAAMEGQRELGHRNCCGVAVPEGRGGGVGRQCPLHAHVR
jgi:hypothetical protein